MQSEAKIVDEYLEEVPEKRKEAMVQLRKLSLAQGYMESMEYGMPGYRKPGGEIELAFASQKNYISLYILKSEVLNKYRSALSGLNLGKGCIRFRKSEQIDFPLVEKLIVENYHSLSEIC
jgi:uncharacterized protein YdhG (YjbR/CyaY superfamily)